MLALQMQCLLVAVLFGIVYAIVVMVGTAMGINDFIFI